MKAQITKVEAKQSQKTGKTAYLVCLKCEDGVSRTSWIDSGYRNYSHWDGLLKVGIDLDNLVVAKNDKYIDADSYPRRCYAKHFDNIGIDIDDSVVDSDVSGEQQRLWL